MALVQTIGRRILAAPGHKPAPIYHSLADTTGILPINSWQRLECVRKKERRSRNLNSAGAEAPLAIGR